MCYIKLTFTLQYNYVLLRVHLYTGLSLRATYPPRPADGIVWGGLMKTHLSMYCVSLVNAIQALLSSSM